MSKLSPMPLSREKANAFIAAHHRHHGRVCGHFFAIGAVRGGDLVGVAIVGRPVSRHLQDGWTAEVTRLCALEGAPNVCSFLYAACWRAARAIGFRRLITYTLTTEPGTSLRAAGWRVVHETRAESWDRRKRPRADKHPTQEKLRWEPAA